MPLSVRPYGANDQARSVPGNKKILEKSPCSRGSWAGCSARLRRPVLRQTRDSGAARLRHARLLRPEPPRAAEADDSSKPVGNLLASSILVCRKLRRKWVVFQDIRENVQVDEKERIAAEISYVRHCHLSAGVAAARICRDCESAATPAARAPWVIIVAAMTDRSKGTAIVSAGQRHSPGNRGMQASPMQPWIR